MGTANGEKRVVSNPKHAQGSFLEPGIYLLISSELDQTLTQAQGVPSNLASIYLFEASLWGLQIGASESYRTPSMLGGVPSNPEFISLFQASYSKPPVKLRGVYRNPELIN